MPNIKFRASRRTLTSHAGLSIIGQCFEIAGVDSIDSIDSRFPTTLGMRTSDVIKSYLGLLCLGMSDYDAVENFRRDKPFQQLLTPQLAYNILRLMGQLGMTVELSPVRHPAKRRRLRTVLQELVHRAALVIHKARQIILDFGQDIGRMTVLKTLRSRLRYPRGTPC